MKQPKIRLKGFEVEWETRTLGNVCSVNRGVRVTRKELSNKESPKIYPVYQNTDYPMGYFNHYNVKSNNPFVIIGGSAGLIGFSDKDFWAADDCAYFGDNANLDKSYLYGLLLNKSLEIKKNVRGSSVPRLDRQVIIDLKISLPSIEEQKAIATYFTNLDSLIQSTTKKIESLKQVKLASLQSMFPQEGETTPRVRFKGFEGEWEKVAIKDIASFSKGHGYSKSDLRETGIPIILYGRMYTKYEVNINNVDTFVLPIPNSVYSYGDEVIMPASGETPEDISCASAVHTKGIILGGDLNIMRFNIMDFNTTFIALSLSSGKTKKQLSNMAQGKSVVHLHNSDIEKVSILMPLYKEQQAIASYFTSLDTQITYQSQRLEKLKQIKSTCLDNMFV